MFKICNLAEGRFSYCEIVYYYFLWILRATSILGTSSKYYTLVVLLIRSYAYYIYIYMHSISYESYIHNILYAYSSTTLEYELVIFWKNIILCSCMHITSIMHTTTLACSITTTTVLLL